MLKAVPNKNAGFIDLINFYLHFLFLCAGNIRNLTTLCLLESKDTDVFLFHNFKSFFSFFSLDRCSDSAQENRPSILWSYLDITLLFSCLCVSYFLHFSFWKCITAGVNASANKNSDGSS